MAELRLILQRVPGVTAPPPESGTAEDVGDLRVIARSDLPALAQELPSEHRPFELRLRTFEKSNLRWYLEQYVHRPVGGFVHRAGEVEATLRHWAKKLLPAAMGSDAGSVVTTLCEAPEPRYLTIESDASSVLALPWELAAVDSQSLAELGVIVRRRPAAAANVGPRPVARSLRVLLVVSRPDSMGYFDHCRTARLLDDVSHRYLQRLEVDLCVPATAARFEAMLEEAETAGRPYGVVHFDGHGVYNALMRRGELCFEREPDAEMHVALEGLSAKALQRIFERYTRPALVVFEACQTAQVSPPLMGAYSPLVGTMRDLEAWAENSVLEPSFEDCVDLADTMSPEELRANAPLLARLGLGAALHDRDLADVPLARSAVGAAISAGVESIVGMSYSAHVDATARFMRELYTCLVAGRTIGEAVDSGRRALMRSRARRTQGSRGAELQTIELEDWFVPQLYQADEDRALAPAESQPRVGGAMPTPVGHGRDLLAAERRLIARPAVLVRGLAGSGKTMFVRELALWMARSKRFPDGIYCVEPADAATPGLTLSALESAPAGLHGDREIQTTSWAELASWLAAHCALVIVDAIERFLPWDPDVPEGREDPGLTSLVSASLENSAFAGRLLMTTRLGRDNPMTASRADTIDLEPLAPDEAIELLERQLAKEDRKDAWRTLDAEVRVDLLNRLAGNPGAIVRATAQWPADWAEAGPESVDSWMAAWARADAEDGAGPGLTAWPLDSLPPLARGMVGLLSGVRGAIAPHHLGRLEPMSSEQWCEIFAAWTRIGLAEPVNGKLPVYRLHPWISYRLPEIVADVAEAKVEKPLALLYGTLFEQISIMRPQQPAGFGQWLGAEWPSLRLQLTQAFEQNDLDRALGVGLLLDDLLLASGLGDARLRLLRNLETAMGADHAGQLGLEVRLRICDWAIAHRQRNDAVAIATASLLEIDDGRHAMSPFALSSTLVKVADVLGQTGYRYASLLVYCRAAALGIEQVRELPDQRSYLTFHLAECLGQLADALGNAGQFDAAWRFVTRQLMAFCAGIGRDQLSLEPFVRFARLLVRQRRFNQAESLFGSFLSDTSRLSDSSLAGWFECRGDLYAWRKDFDEAAQMCTRALAIYEQRQDLTSVLACHRHMGAICLGTGRHPEAKSWFRSALEMAWQRADAAWAGHLLDLLRQTDNRTLMAIIASGMTDAAKKLGEEIAPFYVEQNAKLNGLKEYSGKADAWVRRALELDEQSSPARVPEEFDAAAEIVRRIETSSDAPLATDVDGLLDEQLAPRDAQARSMCTLAILMLHGLLGTQSTLGSSKTR